MKKKQGKKVQEDVKQKIKTEEVKADQENVKPHPISVWDNLVFPKRPPQALKQEDSEVEKASGEDKQGWSWI